MKYDCGVVTERDVVVWRYTPDFPPANRKIVQAVVTNAVGRIRRGGITGCGVTKVRKVGCLNVAGWCTIQSTVAVIQFSYEIGGTPFTEVHQFKGDTI